MTRRALVVLTSHDRMGETGNPTGFWLEELAVPYLAFRDAGLSITVASPAGGEAPLDPLSLADEHQSEATRRFRADAAAMAAVAATHPLAGLRAEDFDLLFFPGGHGPMWDLATDEIGARLVTDFIEAGKPVGSICHGPAALVSARRSDGTPIVAGETVTCFSNREEETIGLHEVVPFLLEDRLRALGAHFIAAEPFDACVAGEGLLVTGQNPASSAELAARLLARIGVGNEGAPTGDEED